MKGPREETEFIKQEVMRLPTKQRPWRVTGEVHPVVPTRELQNQPEPGLLQTGRGEGGKRAFPYLAKLGWSGLSKYAAETQRKNAAGAEERGRSGPGPAGGAGGGGGGTTGNGRGGADATPGRTWSGGLISD